jgi:hypothetical protein
MSEQTEADETEEESNEVNVSRMREMAIRGEEYREEVEIEDYYDMDVTFVVKPLVDKEFLPIAAKLEERTDVDHEEVQDELEDAKEDDGTIDPENFDAEFVEIMQDVCVAGIDRTAGAAEGEDEQGVRENLEKFQGGITLVIAEKILAITSDAGAAESFRRDGGGE